MAAEGGRQRTPPSNVDRTSFEGHSSGSLMTELALTTPADFHQLSKVGLPIAGQGWCLTLENGRQCHGYQRR